MTAMSAQSVVAFEAASCQAVGITLGRCVIVDVHEVSDTALKAASITDAAKIHHHQNMVTENIQISQASGHMARLGNG